MQKKGRVGADTVVGAVSGGDEEDQKVADRLGYVWADHDEIPEG
jgi:hypothetical protein